MMSNMLWPLTETPVTRVRSPRRREFLGQLVLLMLGLAVPAASGCSRGGPVCSDPDLLSTPERELRAAQGYAETSPHGEAKRCSGCQFFTAASSAAPAQAACGSCQILGGPVNPAGHCNSWAAKA